MFFKKIKLKNPFGQFFRVSLPVIFTVIALTFNSFNPVRAACGPNPTAGDDSITCNTSNDTLNALDGNDTVTDSGGTNNISGGNGNDTITTGTGNDTLNGDAGNDNLNGGAGNDTLTGGADNDTLTGGTGNDTYRFDTDTSLGIDIINEASNGGTDTLTFAGSNNNTNLDLNIIGNQVVNSNLTINLTAAEIENLIGGNGNDNFIGTGAANSFTGGAGNDSLSGGLGNDTYNFNTNTALGTDIILENAAGGTDALTFAGSNNDVIFDLGLTGSQAVNTNLMLNLAAVQVENMTGGNGNDTLTGSSAANSLSGGNGNDILNGCDGNDSFTGGAGNDSLNGGLGNDTYNFNTNTALGTDTILENAAGGTDAVSFASSNNDAIFDLGLTGNQLVNANLILNLTATEVENVTGGNGNDTLTGSSAANSLSGGNGNDILNGGDGNDSLTGGAGNDSLNGGLGNDTYNFNTNTALGTDTILENAAGGTDVLTFAGSNNNVIFDLGLTGNQVVNTNLTLNLAAAQAENMTGGNGNDTLTGSSAANSLSGGSGDDILNGGDGNDILSGDAGNDSLTGGNGNDNLTGGAGNDSLSGSAGDDTYNFNTNSALGTDTILENAAGGTDTVTFASSTSNVTINLGVTGNQVVNTNLTLNLAATQVENVTGGNGNDTLTGSSAANSLSGGSGNDTLNGGDGNDILDGGAGNDSLTGGDGIDSLTGGAGNDSLSGSAGDDTYNFNTNSALGTDIILENAAGGTDTVTFASSTSAVTLNLGLTGNQVVNTNLTLNLAATQVENVTGGNGNDTLTGSSAANSLSGGNGNDTLNGGDGNDILDGGAGNDTVNGGNDDDTISTSTGIDIIDGGNGNDTLNITGTHSVGDSVCGGTGTNTFRFLSGTTGPITLVSTGFDTLDFSSFDKAVVIDINKTTQQNVGNSLLITLVGWFESIIGTTYNDTLTGNGLDNNIAGGNGNDILDGGAGIDILDGDSGTDTVNNYQSSDAHTGIEVGIPSTPPVVTPPNTPVNTPVSEPIVPSATDLLKGKNTTTGLLNNEPTSNIIPVTGGSPTEISCDYNPVVLSLTGSGSLSLYNLCSYSIALTQVTETDMVAELPAGLKLSKGLSINFIKENETISQIPAGATVQMNLPYTEGSDEILVGLFWDMAANNQLGAWRVIPVTVENGFAILNVEESGLYLLATQ